MTQIFNKEISTKTSSVVFGVLIIACLFAFYVGAAWNEPIQTPPAGNVPAPINTGEEPQTRKGNLNINVVDGKSDTTGSITAQGFIEAPIISAGEFHDTNSTTCGGAPCIFNINGESHLGGPIGIAPTGGGGTVAINAAGDIKITNGARAYYHNGTPGINKGCIDGKVLSDITISGGIITGAGSCVTPGGGVTGCPSDCDEVYVNESGTETMDGPLTITYQLTVNNTITASEYCIDGSCITEWPRGDVQAEENLRIIRGEISPLGNIRAGSGFSVDKETIIDSQITDVDAGHYVIDFNQPFPFKPTVVATICDPDATPRTLYIHEITTGYVIIRTRINLSTPEERGFCFIAIGPR